MAESRCAIEHSDVIVRDNRNKNIMFRYISNSDCTHIRTRFGYFRIRRNSLVCVFCNFNFIVLFEEHIHEIVNLRVYVASDNWIDNRTIPTASTYYHGMCENIDINGYRSVDSIHNRQSKQYCYAGFIRPQFRYNITMQSTCALNIVCDNITKQIL